jgi:hypothetical protein
MISNPPLCPSQITREYYGLTEVKELIPGGDRITVDKNNRWGPFLFIYTAQKK